MVYHRKLTKIKNFLKGGSVQFKSVDAILCYGFPVGDEDNIPNWAKMWINNGKGLEEKYGLALIAHGGVYDPMYLLVVKESIQEACQGKPISLGQAIDAKPEWGEKLKRFCQEQGVEYQAPQLILCSNWTE